MKPSLISLAQNVASQPFKRSQLGLFHGKMIQHGNNVPFSKQKTRRTWLPNVHNKGLFSQILQKEVDVKLTTRALRTIKKYGGVDQYVLKTKPDLLGYEGMRLRVMIRDRLEVRVASGELPAAALKTPEILVKARSDEPLDEAPSNLTQPTTKKQTSIVISFPAF